MFWRATMQGEAGGPFQTDGGAGEAGGADLLADAVAFLPSVLTFCAFAVLLVVLRRWIERHESSVQGHRFRDQLIMVIVTVVGAVAVIETLPVTPKTRSDLLDFLGLLLSAAIALASTTLLGNVLAGLMLRSMRHFKLGDFLRVESVFGRVTERGLFHTEVQTEDRDLTTLPNLYLATHPVTVVRSTGTIVSATVSLGYDESHDRIRDLLLEAAQRAELQDPFVQITALGDFTIEYRVAGLLVEVKELLSRRTKLRGAMLDVLHGAGIEVASPTLMSTRSYQPTDRFAPPAVVQAPATPAGDPGVEALAFDKADAAESVESLREELDALKGEREELEKRLKTSDDADVQAALRDELERLARREDQLDKLRAAREDGLES